MAVVLVVLYHAAVPGFGGGFVGVDVFFVLSGFLITGLLLREVQRTGTISLPRFYARRARRLIPAAAVVLAATLLGSAVLTPPLLVPDVSRDVASAALYVSNIWFAGQATDYLRAGLAPSPVLHYWSLSLEEQFYLLWPAILLLVIRLAGASPRRLALVVAGITALSLELAIWLTAANQPLAFFLLPARAWELGLGALLAVCTARVSRLPERTAAVLTWSGLALVAAAGVTISPQTPYPGLAALAPTVGAAFVIAGGARPHRLSPGRWLGARLPRFVGRISYSLYLWHWPLLALPAVAFGPHLPWYVRASLIGMSVVLAAATTRWVEDPLRRGWRIGTVPRVNLATAGALSVVLVVASLTVGARAQAHLEGGPQAALASDEAVLESLVRGTPPADAALVEARTAWARPPTQPGPVPAGLRPSLADARGDNPLPQSDGCAAGRETTTADGCVYGNPASHTTVVLVGDSHALAWFPALDRLANDHGWRLVSLTKSACQPGLFSQWEPTLGRVYTECAAWREAVISRIETLRPSLVIVTSERVFEVAAADGTGPANGAPGAWRNGTTRLVERLGRSAGRVLLLADTPRSAVDVPACVSAHPDDALACATPVEDAISRPWADLTAATALDAGAGFIDPSAWVCPSAPCPAIIGPFLVLRDHTHLTASISAALATPLGRAIGVVAPDPAWTERDPVGAPVASGNPGGAGVVAAQDSDPSP